MRFQMHVSSEVFAKRKQVVPDTFRTRQSHYCQGFFKDFLAVIGHSLQWKEQYQLDPQGQAAITIFGSRH